MVDRLLILLAAIGAGGMLLGLYSLYRKKWTPAPDRLAVEELGLELMAGCCAFVVFSSPTCRPCKTALRVVGAAAATNDVPTEVVTIDATERADLATRYEVRTVPTVFLITASGHVIERWRNVPKPDSVDAALAQL